MNSFVKLVLNKKNENRKFKQLRSNENLAKIAVDKNRKGKAISILGWTKRIIPQYVENLLCQW